MQHVLRLHPDQQALTPVQEAEAPRFAVLRGELQLSTAPVDEGAAEAFLQQAYAVAGFSAPQRVRWVDGPLQLVAEASRFARELYAGPQASVQGGLGASVSASLGEHVERCVVADRGKAL